MLVRKFKYEESLSRHHGGVRHVPYFMRPAMLPGILCTFCKGLHCKSATAACSSCPVDSPSMLTRDQCKASASTNLDSMSRELLNVLHVQHVVRVHTQGYRFVVQRRSTVYKCVHCRALTGAVGFTQVALLRTQDVLPHSQAHKKDTNVRMHALLVS